MTAKVATTVLHCDKFVMNRFRLKRKTNPMILFPPKLQLEFISLYFVVPLTKTTTGFQYIFVIFYGYWNITQVVTLKCIYAGVVEVLFA